VKELQDRPDLTDAQKRGVLAENARQLYRLR
jgi:predicted TIM-barrel fold metal-dependent hydrolase